MCFKTYFFSIKLKPYYLLSALYNNKSIISGTLYLFFGKGWARILNIKSNLCSVPRIIVMIMLKFDRTYHNNLL